MAKATSRKCLWIGRKYSKYLAANSFFQLYQVWIPRSELLFWGMANSNNIWKVNCLVFVYVKSSYSHGVLQRSCFENFKNIQEANRWNRLFSRKNPNRGYTLRIYFFENPLEFFISYFTPGNSRQNKVQPLDIPQSCVRFLGNCKAKKKDPWKFHIIFLGHPWKFHFVFN